MCTTKCWELKQRQKRNGRDDRTEQELKSIKRRKRIGFFGGTFNPPHVGHLLIAEQARENADLDMVLFVPAFQPPHKPGLDVIAPRHRLAMVRLAIKGNTAFAASDMEIKQGGISYTVNSLRTLRAREPNAEVYLLMGSDSIRDFHMWKAPEEIDDMAELLVYPRKGFEPDGETKRRVRLLKAPEIELSSTEIRLRVTRGRSIRYLVPAPVEDYIRRNRLYRQEAG